MQVYAVYYEPSGRFLIGQKLLKGYYFYDSGRRPAVKPCGQPLNGGGKLALPGGKRKGEEPIADAARREFMEETGEQIVAERVDTHEFDGRKYGAAFFRIAADTFDKTVMQIFKTNLPQGLAAKDAVIEGTIKEYEKIPQLYPKAPQDNELEDATVWDVNGSDEWKVIATWENDPDLNWYREILRYFKQSILRK